MIRDIFIILSLFSSVCTSFAAEKYVSPGGSGDVCTFLTPCSVEYALSNAVAGDTWYFADGQYKRTYDDGEYRIPAFHPSNSGTITNPITFKSYNHLGATLTGVADFAGAVSVATIGAYQKNYIVWDGFIITGKTLSETASVYGTCRFDLSTGSAVKNSKLIGVVHNEGGSYNNAGVFFENSSYITINNNEFTGFLEASSVSNNGAIIGFPSNHITISNNYIHDCTEGIRFKADVDDSIIENNFVYGCKSGVEISNDNGAESTRNIIRNNIIAANISGIVARQKDGNKPDGTIVYNNTIYGNYAVNVSFGETTIGQGPTLYNNIIGASPESFNTQGDNINVLAADHNQWTGTLKILMHQYAVNSVTYTSLASWQASTELYGGGNPGVGDLASDPQFVTATGARDTVAEFALATGSPCLGAGRDGVNMGARSGLVGVFSPNISVRQFPGGPRAINGHLVVLPE